MSAASPRRRWFQFGIGTMLVFVTLMALVAVWAGSQMNWVRQRRDVINQYQSGTSGGKAPALLWLFGHRGYESIQIAFPGDSVRPLSPAEKLEVERIRRLFPEADVVSGFARVKEVKGNTTTYTPFVPAPIE